MQKKATTIQYRHLKTEGLSDGFELKNSLVDTLKNNHWDTDASKRIIDLDQDGCFVILNKISDPSTFDEECFYGQVIQLHEGTSIQAIMEDLKKKTTEFILKNLNIGKTSKAVKGVLYFVIHKNHIGLIEDQQVKGRTLERYLTALFQKGNVLKPGETIILNSKFLAQNGKELSESSELTVSATPNPGKTSLDENLEPGTTSRESGEAHKQGATVFEVLRMLGWTPDAISRLQDEIPADGFIEGFFRVFIKAKRKRKPISRATIDEALRNIDPSDLGLKGEDGTEKDGIVKLSVKKDIEIVGPLLAPEAAINAIVGALQEWASSGKIDCTFTS